MMDKKSRSKSKGLPKQNGEKFQRFRTKIKKTLSKTMGRSFSTPRSRDNKILRSENDNFNNNRSIFKSNDSSRSSTPDINWFSKMSCSTFSNDNHEQIELNNLNSNHKSHCFINQMSKDKFTFCDVCNRELVPMGSVFACKYCQVVAHESCCSRIDVKCQNNRFSVINNVLEWDKISIKPDINCNTSKSSDNSHIKLRKKAASTDTSPTESQYHTCKTSVKDYEDGSRCSFNFYHGGIETMQCRDSLVSVTSISSMSSLISHLSYDFTTLDRDSIKAYGIQVNPINQRATASLDDSLTDVSSLNSSFSQCSTILPDYNYHCRPSFIYHHITQDIVRVDWTIDDLHNKMVLFNQNNFGLTSEMKSYNGENCLLGTVRVYINLLRPIQMELTSRPSSIFDVIGSKESDDFLGTDAKIETMWLPRGTSKRLYVNQSTSTGEVINGLLKKFYIKANPKKFGLYEHTIEGERRVSARKLGDLECPLTMILTWTEEGIEKFNEIMAVKRLVLQENETGDIEWTGFSRPELRNFMLILEKEEKENSTKIELKYSILKNEILRLQSLLKKA